MGFLDTFKDYFDFSTKEDGPKTRPVTKAKDSNGAGKVTQIRNTNRGGSGDFSEIVTLDPTGFQDVREIADHFCNDIPLVINMASLSEKDSQRTLDFLLGLKEGRHGQLKRVTPKVFLLTPANVSINQDEDEDETEEFMN
jgi:cell division inhibitor SepF